MRQGTYNGFYKVARDKAMKRSNGLCQLCGQRSATEAHHWAEHYPIHITSDDLTCLCQHCHTVATALRRHYRAGGLMSEFIARVKGVEQ